MTNFKQKALEALKQMQISAGSGFKFSLENQHNQTVRDCISRIEAIEEDENIDYDKASKDANKILKKFINKPI